MELLCEACRAVIRIPEEKLPTNSTFRMTCPRCMNKIHVSTKISDAMRESDLSGIAVMDSHENSMQASNNPKQILDERVGSPHIGQASVLLCTDLTSVSSGLKSILQKMGYTVDVPTVVERAMDQLRLNQYQVVLFSDCFGGESPNPIGRYLAGLNMHIRRDMFVILLGEHYKTADPLQAFVESVDLVMHPDDVPQIEMILSKGLESRARFYKVFIECLIDAGKRI